MSFLSEIKNFIKTEILGIEEVSTKSSSARKQEYKPIIECNTEAPEDTFEKTSKETDSKSTANKMSAKAMEETISNIPATSVNLKQMIKNGLLEKVTGCTKEEFEKLTIKEKKIVFDSIQAAIRKYEKMKSEGKINASANLESIIASDAANIYKAISEGIFTNIQEYENAAGDINKDLSKEIDKSTKKARREEFRKHKEARRKKLKEELEKINELPEEKRAAALKRLMLRHMFISRRQLLEVSAQKTTETTVDATLLLEAEDMEYGAKTVLETRNNDEEKTKAADYADYEFTKELIQSNSEAGSAVKADVLKGYTSTYMKHKSSEAAYKYQSSYVQDRNLFEAALKKQQTGEKLTPEEEALLSLMSSDYYTATAQGIGQGILNNVNMTAGEKADFINTWENDAKQYSDYEQVTSDVIKTMSEKAEYKEIKEEFETIRTKTEEKSNNRTVNNSSQQTSKENNRENTEYINGFTPSITTKVNDSSQEVKDRKESKIITNPIKENKTVNKKTKSNPIVIARDIKETGVEQAVKQYGSDAIQIILDYSGFKHLRPQLATIIKSYNLNDLEKITQSCSDSSFIYICSIVNNDFVQALKDNREKTKGLCYFAANQVEKLEGEYATT